MCNPSAVPPAKTFHDRDTNPTSTIDTRAKPHRTKANERPLPSKSAPRQARSPVSSRPDANRHLWRSVFSAPVWLAPAPNPRAGDLHSAEIPKPADSRALVLSDQSFQEKTLFCEFLYSHSNSLITISANWKSRGVLMSMDSDSAITKGITVSPI